MASGFHKHLVAFVQKLEKSQSTRRKERLDRLRALEEKGQVLAEVILSPDISQLFNRLRSQIAAEKSRYTPAPPPPPVDLTAAPEVAPPPPQPAMAPTAFVQELQLALSPFLQPLHISDEVPPTLTPEVRYYATLLLDEMASLTSDNPGTNTTGSGVMPRLMQARQAIFADRMNDALTILRTAYKAHPHSHMLMFLLSQFLYLMYHLGHQGTLPEARDLAQKSTLATEKSDPDDLLRYRYHAIVTELGHDPARALDWLRGSGLLAPELLQTAKGLAGHQAIPLKAWMILAEVPATHWAEGELRGLHQMALYTPGGALLYLACFRTALNAESHLRKEPLPHLGQLEHMLQMSWLLYHDIAAPLSRLAQVAPGASATQPNTAATWTVRTRYAYAVAGVCPTPAFDHVLLHIALDGRTVSAGYPDQFLRVTLDDPNISYWRLWANCLAPEKEARLPHMLPAAETFEDLEFFTELTELLNNLRAEEASIIRRDIWPDLQPWLTRYLLDHLLAAGTGSNRPRLRFTPALPPYSNYYRRWSDPSPTSVLPSEIIAENARRGGFASLFEVMAAFDGAARLLHDPVHGLVPAQKRALEAARQANPAKYKNVNFELAGSPALKAGFLGILLLAGIAGAFSLTANTGQAIGLSLVVAGLVGMLGVQMARPSHT